MLNLFYFIFYLELQCPVCTLGKCCLPFNLVWLARAVCSLGLNLLLHVASQQFRLKIF